MLVPSAALIAVIALPLVLIWEGPGALDAAAALLVLAASRGSQLLCHRVRVG